MTQSQDISTRQQHLYRGEVFMVQGNREDDEMVKTALFETLVESAVVNGDGTLTFTLEGKSYQIKDTLEISKIAQDHDYIIIY